VRQEILGHNARDLLEVVEDGVTGILLPLVISRWAELAEFVVGVESHVRFRFELILGDGARVAERTLAMQTLTHKSAFLRALKLRSTRHA